MNKNGKQKKKQSTVQHLLHILYMEHLCAKQTMKSYRQNNECFFLRCLSAQHFKDERVRKRWKKMLAPTFNIHPSINLDFGSTTEQWDSRFSMLLKTPLNVHDHSGVVIFFFFFHFTFFNFQLAIQYDIIRRRREKATTQKHLRVPTLTWNYLFESVSKLSHSHWVICNRNADSVYTLYVVSTYIRESKREAG